MRDRRHARVLLLGLLALLALSSPAAALGGAWRVARLFGADVRSLAVAPEDPDVLLAGTSAGHVYRSRDGGATWSEAAAALPLRGYVVGALRFDPNRPARVWASLWGIWGGGAVAFSDDLGASWVDRSAGLPGTQVYTVAVAPGAPGAPGAPSAPGRLYAATREGVWGSDDEGVSWRHLTAAHPEIVNVSSLHVDERNPRVVIAGTWRRAYRSDDGGASWRGIFTGMVLDSEVFTLQADPRDPDSLWASTCGWVYHTPDLGATWTRFREGMQERRTPSFEILPDGALLAGTVRGTYRSADAGKSWQRTSPAGISVLAIASHPQRPQRVWIGTEGSGIWRSDDGGRSFAAASEGMTNVRVSALLARGNEVLAAVPHAGPGSGVYRSRDGGLTFDPQPDELPTVLDLATHEGRVFAATEGGLYVRREGRWQAVPELGAGRVDQLAAGGRRLVARAGGKLWELAYLTERLKMKEDFVDVHREKWVEVPYRHGTPRSISLTAEALWVTDAAGLYRLADGENHTVDTPLAGGRVTAAGERPLLTGSGGAYRLESDRGWSALVAAGGAAARALPTGDAAYPALLLGEREAHLVRAATAELVRIELPIPTRDVLAALVTGARLLLGTSGYGVLVRDLYE